MTEYILCAAIHFDDGKIYPHQPKNIVNGIVVCGRRHHNCFTTYSQMSIDRTCKKTQGFLTNTDKFVDRQEAADIAFKASQSKVTETLFSEDLY
jgi:hypothetical protein